MKKLSYALIFLLAFSAAGRVSAFWPFEKKWNYDNSTLKNIAVADDGFVYRTSTAKATVGDFIDEQQLEISERDLVFPDKTSALVSGMTISIVRAMHVKVEADGKELDYYTHKRYAEDVLAQRDIYLSRLDKVEPKRGSLISDGDEILVTRINVEEVTEVEKIEYKTVEKDDPKLRWRKTRVDQEGEDGSKDVKYKITYTNGKVTSKVKLSEEVTKKVQNKIVAVGTKIEVGKVKTGRGSWYAYTGTMACASIQFPKGTWLRVTNKGTGKQVIVQVNDYGPDAATGKIIDLDSKAFAKLAPLGAGVIDVKIEEILE